MENLPGDPRQSQLMRCPVCIRLAEAEDAFCAQCGYPLKGAEQDQKNFLFNRKVNEIVLREHDKKIGRAATILKWVGGFTMISGAYYASIRENKDEALNLLIFNTVLGCIYFFFGLWCKKKPMAVIVTGLCLYVLVSTLNLIFEPMSILPRIIIPMLIIMAFINGIRSVIEADKIKKGLYYD